MDQSLAERTEYFRGDTGANRKTAVLGKLLQNVTTGTVNSVLVVGCGDGSDAAALAALFGVQVDGVDMNDYFSRAYADRVRFQVMDACALDFPDNYFDVVYSFHALEHIPDPEAAVREMKRVLKPGGAYCLGTPNKNRLVGYVGVPGYSLSRKIRSNMRDWMTRLAGKWDNALGAHAGFTQTEIDQLGRLIGPGTSASRDYFTTLYSRHGAILRMIRVLGLEGLAYPSVYVIGRR